MTCYIAGYGPALHLLLLPSTCSLGLYVFPAPPVFRTRLYMEVPSPYNLSDDEFHSHICSYELINNDLGPITFFMLNSVEHEIFPAHKY